MLPSPSLGSGGFERGVFLGRGCPLFPPALSPQAAESSWVPDPAAGAEQRHRHPHPGCSSSRSGRGVPGRGVLGRGVPGRGVPGREGSLGPSGGGGAGDPSTPGAFSQRDQTAGHARQRHREFRFSPRKERDSSVPAGWRRGSTPRNLTRGL